MGSTGEISYSNESHFDGEEEADRFFELSLHDGPSLATSPAGPERLKTAEDGDLYKGPSPRRGTKLSQTSSRRFSTGLKVDEEAASPPERLPDPPTDSGAASASAQSAAAPVSRRELLDIVRKHSDDLPLRRGSLLAPLQSDFSGSLAADPRYWREMLDLFFVRGWGSGDKSMQFQHDALFDDMLFFVRLQDEDAGSGEGDGSPAHDKKPFFVRRWNNHLNNVVGATAAEVDWRRSFYLNLICHTVYTLTVAVCSRQALDNHRKSRKGLPVAPIKKITKRVYASPSMARVDSDTPMGKDMTPAYPDIFFSIDNCNDTFEPVELHDADHCLCVLLNAHGGAAFPADELSAGRQRRRRSSTVAHAFGETSDDQPKVTLFSGYVSYSMVRANFHGGRVGTFGLWGRDSFPAERLSLRGPGGRGEADITVSCAADDEQQGRGEADPDEPSLPSLQVELGAVQDDLMRLLEEHQQNAQENLLSPEKRAEKEAAYQCRLKQLHAQLKLVQHRLHTLQLKEKEKATPRPPLPPPPRQIPGGLADFMRRAAQYTVAPSRPPALLCTLRALSLPWNSLAYDLLFKEMPVKVDITGHLLPRLPSRAPEL